MLRAILVLKTQTPTPERPNSIHRASRCLLCCTPRFKESSSVRHSSLTPSNSENQASSFHPRLFVSVALHVLSAHVHPTIIPASTAHHAASSTSAAIHAYAAHVHHVAHPSHGSHVAHGVHAIHSIEPAAATAHHIVHHASTTAHHVVVAHVASHVTIAAHVVVASHHRVLIAASCSAVHTPLATSSSTTPAAAHHVVVVSASSLETTTAYIEVPAVLMVVVVCAALVVELARLAPKLLLTNSAVLAAVRITHRCVPGLELIFRTSARLLCGTLSVRTLYFALSGSRSSRGCEFEVCLATTLAIDLVLAESNLSQLGFGVCCGAEGSDIFFGRPPVELGYLERREGAWIDRAAIGG
jgi:hypothetical protein